MGHFERHALPLQLGGRPGIAVSQASQSLRCICFSIIRNVFANLQAISTTFGSTTGSS